MGMIERLLAHLFGGVTIRETVEIFREYAETRAVREATAGYAALQRTERFDRVIDRLNRVPRLALALGTLGLFVAAMVDPIWFAERMQSIALAPEPLWWPKGGPCRSVSARGTRRRFRISSA